MTFSGANFWRYLALGITLRGLSMFFETMGNASPLGLGGVTGERVVYQVLALLVFIAAVFCGGKLVVMIMRALNENPISDRLQADPETRDETAKFDPDFALSRYMARRTSEEEVATPLSKKPQLAAPQVLGRRVV